LAVGITFALISDIHLGISVGIIGVITFFVCACGVYIGNIFGAKYKEKAQIFGGILLILLGFKIFFDGIQVF
jgi:putative Mn2+ efflux pump MntP